MTTSPTPLPDYDSPPVIEVVCGMQFAPLTRFQATAFGVLWQRFRSEYPTRETQPPLGAASERFDITVDRASGVEIVEAPLLPRVFFVHKSPCWLMQVQQDRFLHNWRKQHESDKYPHFPEVHRTFWSAWEQFLLFCQDENVGDPNVNQLELTYINHIAQGCGWDGVLTVGNVFPDLAWRSSRSFLPAPETLAWRTSFVMPDKSGRLHVSVRHAIRRQDMTPVLLCELTARGMPDSPEPGALTHWFFQGREWIVRAFAELTNEDVQRDIWKRKKV